MTPNNGDTKLKLGEHEGLIQGLDGRLERLEHSLDRGLGKIFDKLDGQFGDCNQRFGRLERAQAISGVKMAGIIAVTTMVSGGIIALIVRALS